MREPRRASAAMKTLLLVDDSVTIQRVIELTFAHEDVRVISVSDGRLALEWMENDVPDIVLVDVEVPEVDGYAISSHVKQSPRLKNVPVLLLAGAFEPVDDQRAKSAGSDGVLVKPFEPKQLVARVKALLARPADDESASSRSGDGAGATVTPFPAPAFRAAETAPVPAMPAAPAPAAAARSPFEMHLPSGEPEPLEPPTRPLWEDRTLPPEAALAAAPDAMAARVAPAAPPKVSLVNAFSALLDAEQAAPVPPAAAAPVISDATVEDAVRRVLARMTDDLVRRLVVETAERLIREEIDKIKADPE